MNSKILKSENGEVHYWVQGNGKETIVFTHGATVDNGLFKYQVDYFAKKYKVITWDVPCHGYSRPYEGFSLKKAASELINILNIEEIEKAHFVGQSMGGYIIQEVYLEDKKRVASLTTIGSNPFGHEYLSSFDRWALNNTKLFFYLYPYKKLIKDMAKGTTLTDESRNYALNTFQKLNKQEMIEILDSLYKDFCKHKEKVNIDCPLLITYGEFDKTGKVQRYCNEWADYQGIKPRAISKAAHNANLDNPTEFNEVLEKFISTVGENCA